MLDTAALLTAYDAQLRGAAELPSAVRLDHHGPLVWGVFVGGVGFVTYHDLGGATEAELRDLVRATARRYQDDPEITEVEWKTRGHDHAPGLHDLLVEHGFEPGDPETVMVGRSEDLVSDAVLPDDVSVRRISEPDDVRRMCVMADEAFGDHSPGWRTR